MCCKCIVDVCQNVLRVHLVAVSVHSDPLVLVNVSREGQEEGQDERETITVSVRAHSEGQEEGQGERERIT